MENIQRILMIFVFVTSLTVTYCQTRNSLSTLLLEPLQQLGNETLNNDIAIHAVAKAVNEILEQTEELDKTVSTLKQLNESLYQLQTTARVDDCASSPCVHGLCRDFLAGYSCHCSPGYTGTRCQDIDDCPLNACGLQGSCIDLTDDYRCICWNGAHGKNCDQYQDCYEIMESGKGTESGVYNISVNIDGSQQSKQVYCDMSTDDGGWTVLMNRYNGEENFARAFMVLV